MNDTMLEGDVVQVEAVASAAGKALRRDRQAQVLFREAVITAARDLFVQEGAEGLSMRRIAASVGTAPMTLYRYFPSKQHLMRHIWDDLLTASLSACSQGAALQPDPLRRPGAFAGAFIAHWAAQPGNYLLVFTAGHQAGLMAGAGLQPFAQLPAVQRHVDALQALLDAGLHPRVWPEAERRRLVEWVICQCFGYLHPMVTLAHFDWRDPDLLRCELVAGIDEHVRAAVVAVRRGAE